MHNPHPFNGFIGIDKPIGASSSKMVYGLRKILQMRKIGHAGTLDPFASGVLPLAMGEATKAIDYLHNASKTYQLTIAFGQATNTNDCEGEVVQADGHIPSLPDIEAILPEFCGMVRQIPPAFSAIKINGKRAYKLARDGNAPTMPERVIKIERITLNGQNENGHVLLEVTSGKGAYMRALARDIAVRLGTYAYLSALRRSEYGGFNENNIFSLENAEKMMHQNKIQAILQPIHKALTGILVLYVTVEQANALKSGLFVAIRSLFSENPDIIHQISLSDVACLAVVRKNSQEQAVAIVTYRDGLIVPKRVFNFDTDFNEE